MHDIYATPNSYQTKEERQDKRNILRSYDVPSSVARQLRDWNWSKLTGQLTIYLSQQGVSTQDIAEAKQLCESHYQKWYTLWKQVQREENHDD